MGSIASSAITGIVFHNRVSDGGVHLIGAIMIGVSVVAVALSIFVPQAQIAKRTKIMPVNPLGVALRNRRAGQHTLVWARPDLQAPESFTLTSPAFDHGAPIPEQAQGRLIGANISPALAWTSPPAGTAELVLIAQDPDVPMGKPATHALTVGVDPSLNGIQENGLANPSPVPGLRHGKGALGRRGWAGPHAAHGRTGRTTTSSSSSPSTRPRAARRFTLDDVINAIAGHVIARARLDGTYEIR